MPTPSLFFASGYAPADHPGLQAFTLDETTGALTAQAAFAGILNPSFVVVHPHGRRLYVASENNAEKDGVPGRVWALRFTLDPVTIEAINHQPSGGDWPCHVQIDATGRWLLVSNYGPGNARLFPILFDGALGEMSDFVQHSGSGPNPARQEGPHAHSATFTPDNGYALIADLGLDQIVLYRFDAARGKLFPHGHLAGRPGAGPRHMAFHPNGQILYVANELDSTVSVCEYDSAKGTLREVQALDTLPSPRPESWVADVHVSGDGKRVYVSNRGHDSLAVFEADVAGRLTRLGMPSCGGSCPRNFALAPGGNFVLSANQMSNQLAVMPVLRGAAEVGAPTAHASVTGASCIKFVK